MRPPLVAAALLLVAACGTGLPGGDGAAGDADGGTPPGDGAAPAADSGDGDRDAGPAPADLGGGAGSDGGLVGARPYRSRIPAGYDGRPTPLVILLHGYGASALEQDVYFGLSRIVDDKGFLYAYPDGTFDRMVPPMRFWNATDSCCNFYGLPVDDVAYLDAIVDDMASRYNVDPKRVYVIGHSNGGFMAHRFACERSSRVAAIISLAGANWKDATKCQPSSPVSVLQIHGTADAVIKYGGGHPGNVNVIPQYPSAAETVATWAARNRCGGPLAATGRKVDVDRLLPGDETRVEAYGGCPDDGAVERWTIQGGAHVPPLASTWAATLWDFLAAHPKP